MQTRFTQGITGQTFYTFRALLTSLQRNVTAKTLACGYLAVVWFPAWTRARRRCGLLRWDGRYVSGARLLPSVQAKQTKRGCSLWTLKCCSVAHARPLSFYSINRPNVPKSEYMLKIFRIYCVRLSTPSQTQCCIKLRDPMRRISAKLSHQMHFITHFIVQAAGTKIMSAWH